MNVTLQVMLNAPDHPLEGMKAAARYKTGDILNVYITENCATLQGDSSYKLNSPCTHPRFAFVHITGVPDISINTIRKKLSIAIEDNTDPEKPTLVRRRLWHIPTSIVPVGIRQTLLTDHEVTLTWSQVKPYIRKKLVSNALAPDTDNITTELQDIDL